MINSTEHAYETPCAMSYALVGQNTVCQTSVISDPLLVDDPITPIPMSANPFI